MSRKPLKQLKPRIQPLQTWVEAKGIKTLRAPRKTLREKQEANGRTLALNGAKWRRLRAIVLRDNPLCRLCAFEDRLTLATDVDHIDGNPANNSLRNLQSLCHECHSRKTQADMGHRVKHGCDANGMPADPGHPWNRER